MERMITVFTYALLACLWGSLTVLYLRHRSTSGLRDPLVASLLSVLALDAFKSLVESVYFGVLWGSRYEVLPRSWGLPLESPWMMPIPKLFNVAVALILLWRVVGRFIPDELKERERRRTEEADLRAARERDLARVEESERRLQSLFTATTDLVSFWVADKNKGFVLESMNPAAKTFFSVVNDTTVNGADVTELLGAEFRGLLMESVATRQPVRRDASPVETPNGSRIINTQLVPVVDDDGRVVRVAALSHDITELTRRAQEEEQRTRLESLGLLAGGVAHDFNNLLAVVKADVDLAREGSNADDKVLAHAGDAIARARELVEQLMSTAGARAKGLVDVDVGAVVDDTVRLLVPAAHGVTLSASTTLPAGQRAVVNGDRAQLQQIVLNLVQNAAEAAARDDGGAKGKVAASVVVKGDSVVVVVEDDGHGIPAEVQARMFDPFFTTKKEGRGLGLSTVFGLAQAHGGHVEVASEPGRGARFTVTLPRATTSSAAKKEPSTPWPKAPTSQPGVPLPVRDSAEQLRILLIDDDDLVRRASRRLLERLGHTVTDVSSGKAALDFKDAFDVAVVDVTMPDLDGPATLQRLRKRRQNLPAVIITGRGDVAVDDDVVLPKPFDLEALQKALVRALEKGRARS